MNFLKRKEVKPIDMSGKVLPKPELPESGEELAKPKEPVKPIELEFKVSIVMRSAFNVKSIEEYIDIRDFEVAMLEKYGSEILHQDE